MEDMTASASGQIRVRSPRADDLSRLLAGSDAGIAQAEADVLSITGLTSTEIAKTALAAGILLTELTPVHASLEDAYLALTAHDVQYQAMTHNRTDPGRAAA